MALTQEFEDIAIKDTKKPGEEMQYWPRRFGHANLFSTDWLKSMEWYINIAGVEESYRRMHANAGFLCNGNTHHDVACMQYGNGHSSPLQMSERAGLNHFAFELENEVELIVGYRRILESDTLQRTEDHDNTYSVYSWDPDGHGTEIYCDPVKNWRAIKSGILTRGVTTWTPSETPFTEPGYDMDYEQRRIEDAVFHPLRATHGVHVISEPNYTATYEYYKETMGFRPILGGPDDYFTSFAGSIGERTISIFKQRPHLEPCFHHFGMIVAGEEDFDKSIARCKKEGIELFGHIDHPSRHTVAIKDPDGILVQFYVERDVSLTSLDGVSREDAIWLV